MDREAYEKRKAFAGPTKPSMHRRRIGHDYQLRRIYLITMTVEGRGHCWASWWVMQMPHSESQKG
ncbi:MAG: hypothetical protein J6T11_06660 [Bacteroidaceae bacterium]|nr:hypothetical protein [Bacteroidaceae bacterium]